MVEFTAPEILSNSETISNVSQEDSLHATDKFFMGC